MQHRKPVPRRDLVVPPPPPLVDNRSRTRPIHAYVMFGLMVISVLSFAWSKYQSVRALAAKSEADTSFYGASNASWDGRTIVEATAESHRQFPYVVAGPEEASAGAQPHTIRLPFRAEDGYPVSARIIQADSHDANPPVLHLSLNGGVPVPVAIVRGAGRDPLTTERAAPQEYRIELPGQTVCGDNEVRLTAADGRWVAIERIDIQLLPTGDGATFAAVGIVSLTGSMLLAFIAGTRALRGHARPARSLSVVARAAGARVFLAVVALAVGLLLVEGILPLVSARSKSINRLLYSSRSSDSLPDTPEILNALMAHRCAEAACSLFLGFRLNGHGFHTHDYQYPKPPGVTRIVGIGDSFMFYGGPVPAGESFFIRLEDAARRSSAQKRFEFVNLGFSCIGIPSEHALLSQEGLRLDPDLVIWTIYLGNDITDEEHANLDQLKQVGTLPGRPQSWFDRWLVFRLAAHVADLVAHDPKLLFTRCAPTVRHKTLAPTGRCGYLEEPDSEQPYDPGKKSLSDDRYLIYGVDRLRTMYSEQQRPHIQQLVAALLRQFAAVREEVGLQRLLLVLIPDQFQVSPAEVDRILAAEPSLRREAFDFGYTIRGVHDGLVGLGFDVLDLTGALREAIASGIDPYQPNDGHFSVAGNRLAAQQIASALRRKGVLPGAAPGS